MLKYKHKDIFGGDIISLIDVMFMSVPEIVVLYLLVNSFIANRIKFENILKISLIFGVFCYLIKNLFSGGVTFIMIFILSAVLYISIAKINLVSGYILFALSYGIKFVSEFIIITIASSKGFNFFEIANNQTLKIIFFYMTLLIPIAIILFNSKKNTNILNIQMQKKIKLDKKKLIMYGLIILALANTLIISLLVVTTKINDFGAYSIKEILLIIMMITTVISLIMIVMSLDKNNDIALIEKNLMTSNLKQMEETVDLLRIQKHDVMNHLQVILMQISNGKSEDARKYILGLAEDVKNIGIVFDTGNNYIDAILNFKNQKCSDSKIELTACIDSILENTRLDDTQLSSIFLNIIDNAIDELKKSNKEYKYIHVDTYCENNNHIIAITNNGPKIKEPEKIFEMGVSSKGKNRGYGLYSIRQLLLENKSRIDVISDDDETQFIIEIPICKKDMNIANNM